MRVLGLRRVALTLTDSVGVRTTTESVSVEEARRRAIEAHAGDAHGMKPLHAHAERELHGNLAGMRVSETAQFGVNGNTRPKRNRTPRGRAREAKGAPARASRAPELPLHLRFVLCSARP